MIDQAGVFKALLGMGKAALDPLTARRRKRKQLREALWRAVDRAANAVPEDRDPFRTKSFVERDLAAQARRMAKRVDHDLVAKAVADLFVLRFPGSSSEPEQIAVRRKRARTLGRTFVAALHASLLEKSEWRDLVQAKLVLQTHARVQRMTAGLPAWDWTEVVSGAAAWTAGALASASEARARLGQEVNLDDPSLRLKVPRPAILEAIGSAIQADPRPVLIEGEEGVGKTWAALEAARANRSPETLLLVVPCRSVLQEGLETLVARTLRERLVEGDVEGWRERLAEWFPLRPLGTHGAPRIVLLLDGLNQNALIDWRPLIDEAMGERWWGTLKLVLTVRPRHGRSIGEILHYKNIKPHIVPINGFDDAELALALAAVGRPDLPHLTANASLQNILRTPRYFRIATRLWDTVSDLGEVTPNRLILEDLRLQYVDRHGELERDAWSSLLAKLGHTLLASGKPRFGLGEIQAALAGAGLSAGRIESGLHDIASGRLFQDAGGGTLVLSEDLAPLAAGMALIMVLGETPATTVSECLDGLDAAMPDLGTDVRAGALGAAAAIALCWNGPRLGRADRAGLLTAWLTSQNPTYGDAFDAQAYVRGDPVAYLDAYEAIAITVEPDRRALHVLEEALEVAMDMEDLQAAVRIRALGWAGYVGMREAFLGADRRSETEARGRHLAAMLGEIPQAGPLRILDCDLTLVAGWDPDFLLRLAARLLAQGPLADQVDLFRTAAVALSVGHAHDGWKAMKWTARLNRFDPMAADQTFRVAARALSEALGESDPFFALAQTAARKLYDLVSQEADEASMAALEAAVPTQWRQLLAEYDADPARSSIALSPLDVEAVSARSDIKPYVLMRRVQDHYWDPARQFAPHFREVLLEEAAEHWKPGELSASRYNTETSILFELLDQAMARVAPEALGDYARAFARHVAEREGMPLETGLWRVEDQVIALGEPEIAALEDRLFSLDPANQDQDREDHSPLRACLNLVELIVPRRSAGEQLALLIQHAGEKIGLSLGSSLKPLSHEQVREALNAAGDDRGVLVPTLAHLALSRYEPSAEVAERLERHALGDDDLLEALALQVLATAPAPRLARGLVEIDWRWRSERHFANHYGSIILAKAGKAMSFDQLIDRIAPGLLPWAVDERGGAADEIAACAEVLELTLVPAPNVDRDEPGMAIQAVGEPSLERPQEVRASFAPPDCETERFHLAFEPELREQRLRDGLKRAVARIRRIEGVGAVFYSRDLHPQGLGRLVGPFTRWAEDLLSDRQRLSHARYFAPYLLTRMSQVLLEARPELGARLWNAVAWGDDEEPAVKAAAGGDFYLKVLFAAPVSPGRDALIQRVWSSTEQASDLGLLAIVNAAEVVGAGQILDTLIAEDLASDRAYRQARAWQAQGFRVEAPLDEDLRTERRAPCSWVLRVRKAAAERAARNAAARHWYARFIACPDRDEALAAWLLLLQVVDRRFWSWRRTVEAAVGGAQDLRHAHFAANRQSVERAIAKNEKALAERFLEEAL
jgi:hypothetical protein